MIKIGLLGYGNIAEGLEEILSKNASRIKKRCGHAVEIKSALVRDLSKVRKGIPPHIQLTTHPADILDDPEISIVVEVMGGEHPALELLSDAIKAKKHVVTANKLLIAVHKEYLFDLAKTHAVKIGFEASVGGGIPLIKTLKVGLSPNEIEAIYGIVNGTTNFILSQIETEKKEFHTALKHAQKLGFAEADPHMDVSGLDAAYKLIILANVGFKVNIQLSDMSYEGITSISKDDIDCSNQLGYTIKLLAIGRKRSDGQYIFKVHPTLIPKTHPLAHIQNELNAIYIQSKGLGETLLSGKGAGPLPTGSAIASDIIDIILDGPHTGLRQVEAPAKPVTPLSIDLTHSQFFIRLTVTDTLGVLETVSRVLGKHHISIAKLIQQPVKKNTAQLLIITHPIIESELKAGIEEVKKESVILAINSLIRVGLDEN